MTSIQEYEERLALLQKINHTKKRGMHTTKCRNCGKRVRDPVRTRVYVDYNEHPDYWCSCPNPAPETIELKKGL